MPIFLLSVDATLLEERERSRDCVRTFLNTCQRLDVDPGAVYFREEEALRTFRLVLEEWRRRSQAEIPLALRRLDDSGRWHTHRNSLNS